jgi:hypothetical protein
VLTACVVWRFEKGGRCEGVGFEMGMRDVRGADFEMGMIGMGMGMG